MSHSAGAELKEHPVHGLFMNRLPGCTGCGCGGRCPSPGGAEPIGGGQVGPVALPRSHEAADQHDASDAVLPLWHHSPASGHLQAEQA